MEQPKTPNFRRLAVFFSLFILLSLAFLFWARDIIRELVVLPLSYLIWVFGILIDYTPQLFFWIILLLIASMIAFGSLRGRRIKASNINQYAVDQPDPLETPGRVSFWETRVNFLKPAMDDYYSHSFNSALGKLLIDMLAYRYRMTTKQVEVRLREGTLDLPPDVLEYALGSLRPPELGSTSFWGDLWDQVASAIRNGLSALRGFLLKITGSLYRANRQPAGFMDQKSFEGDDRVRRILEFMEEELEVPHDVDDAGR